MESMERHGHLRLDPVVRSAVLEISAATIDRLFRPVREATGRADAVVGVLARPSNKAFRYGLLLTGANRRRVTARPTWWNTAAGHMRAISYIA